MKSLPGCKRIVSVFFLCAGIAIAASAQTVTTLVTFSGSPSSGPGLTQLVQGLDGNFYGTTYEEGTANSGSVFKVTPGGVLTTLYSFCTRANCADGSAPWGALTLGTDGNFYGTTSNGGKNNVGGTVFKITPAGTLTTLHSFCQQVNCNDGTTPEAGLIQGADGNFYGTTRDSGANGYGVVFRITPAGAFKVLYNFCSQPNCTDGLLPVTKLVQGANGNFYGTTSGLDTMPGTIFELTPGGTLTTLFSFCTTQSCTYGSSPSALIQTANGDFYGTTANGGAFGYGTAFEFTSGSPNTLYSFCAIFGCPDGAGPSTGVVQATNGVFYGTTSEGGANANGTLGGTIFSITGSVESTVYSFCAQANCADGTNPGALMQATNGSFYGVTSGGNIGAGTIYRLSVGLGPFVELLPARGKVGASVTILGNNLTGTTAVSFNGTAATFTVVSNTEITTTVPTGATSGKVSVTTSHGTLKSNASFRVTP